MMPWQSPCTNPFWVMAQVWAQRSWPSTLVPKFKKFPPLFSVQALLQCLCTQNFDSTLLAAWFTGWKFMVQLAEFSTKVLQENPCAGAVFPSINTTLLPHFPLLYSLPPNLPISSSLPHYFPCSSKPLKPLQAFPFPRVVGLGVGSSKRHPLGPS